MTQDEDSVQADRGSSDRASIHSISHIIELTKDTSPSPDTTSHTEENDSSRIRQSTSMNFETPVEEVEEASGEDTGDITDAGNEEEAEDQEEEISGTFMIRSETDEFQQIHQSHTINICDVTAESIKWLAGRLGPLLTAKHLSKNLIRMLALCYLGEEQIVVLQENGKTL